MPVTRDLVKAELLLGNQNGSHRWRTNKCARKYRRLIIGGLGLSILLAVTIIYIINHDNLEIDSRGFVHINVPANTNVSGEIVPTGYSVWSPQCKMLDPDVLNPDVLPFAIRYKPVPCSKQNPLTKIDYNNLTGRSALVVTSSRLAEFSVVGDPDCCYRNIRRYLHEYKVRFSACIPFNQSVVLDLSVEFISVKCKNANNYENVHFVVQRKPEVVERLEQHRVEGKRAASIMMVGIDSVSRLNLLRTMPETAQLMYDDDWFEMKGYNKMADNTYPNLMAVLTGISEDEVFQICDPYRKKVTPTSCPLIWNLFKEHGYVTAYIEDEVDMSTFNYLKKGFNETPVDYYGRTGLLVAEELQVVRVANLKMCMGYQYSADYIYHYGRDIAEMYRGDPVFGLYWANSFSHGDLNTPSTMDFHMHIFMQSLKVRGILDDQIVIFFSDHGFRMGRYRRTFTGWLEESLPFLFIWLPPWFRKEHPDIVEALRINRNRLTTPYHLHLTLMHILRLSGRLATKEKYLAKGCPLCGSLFEIVPNNRSCSDFGIDRQWCTCDHYDPVDMSSRLAVRASRFVIDSINSEIITNLLAEEKNEYLKTYTCAKLHLEKIMYLRQSPSLNGTSHILIGIKAGPQDPIFEATLVYDSLTETLTLPRFINRLNMYDKDSWCVNLLKLKKYCICVKR